MGELNGERIFARELTAREALDYMHAGTIVLPAKKETGLCNAEIERCFNKERIAVFRAEECNFAFYLDTELEQAGFGLAAKVIPGWDETDDECVRAF